MYQKSGAAALLWGLFIWCLFSWFWIDSNLGALRAANVTCEQVWQRTERRLEKLGAIVAEVGTESAIEAGTTLLRRIDKTLQDFFMWWVRTHSVTVDHPLTQKDPSACTWRSR